MEKQMPKQLLRFVLVGCANFTIGLIVTLIAYYPFGLGYWLSSALNYLVSSTCSYFLNRKYTFQCDQEGWFLALKFTLNIIFCYFLAYSIAQPAVVWLAGPQAGPAVDFLAMLAGMGLFSLLNYAGQSRFVFTSRNKAVLQPKII